MKFFKVLALIMIFINLCISLILLFVFCPRVIRHDNLGFDYIGVLVTILALLVTFLVAWNIFTALDFKREMLKKIEDCRKSSKHDLQLHSDLNQKEFDNIVKGLERANSFVKKMDDALYEHLSNSIIKDAGNGQKIPTI